LTKEENDAILVSVPQAGFKHSIAAVVRCGELEQLSFSPASRIQTFDRRLAMPFPATPASFQSRKQDSNIRSQVGDAVPCHTCIVSVPQAGFKHSIAINSLLVLTHFVLTALDRNPLK
jgi:hypothetical protein